MKIDRSRASNKLLDFEASDLGPLGIITGDGFIFTGTGKGASVVSSPYEAYSFGRHALKTTNLGGGAVFTATSANKYLKSLEFEVYNKHVQNGLSDNVRLSIVTSTGQSYVQDITLKITASITSTRK